MKRVLLILTFLLPLFGYGQRSTLSRQYPEVDWKVLSTWPVSIEKGKEKFTLVVSGGGGCVVYTPIEGRLPTEEEKKRWGALSAWYEPEGKKELGEYRIYGPYFHWNRAGEIQYARFSNGKGAIRQYDKNWSIFRVARKNEDGYESIFYIDKYGQEALEFRTKDDSYHQYRKPCSTRQFYEMKEQMLERFDLHQPISKIWP